MNTEYETGARKHNTARIEMTSSESGTVFDGVVLVSCSIELVLN